MNQDTLLNHPTLKIDLFSNIRPGVDTSGWVTTQVTRASDQCAWTILHSEHASSSFAIRQIDSTNYTTSVHMGMSMEQVAEFIRCHEFANCSTSYVTHETSNPGEIFNDLYGRYRGVFKEVLLGEALSVRKIVTERAISPTASGCVWFRPH